jgi:nucleotidyltransferase substrate binding protein (TIGR01987 family)
MTNMIGEIDISNFLKAREQFEEYRKNIVRKQDRAGAIQAFEFTYEMCWKTMKRLLSRQGVIDINSPRSCFREAAKIGMISDPKNWFNFIEIRNLTVHTYSEQNVEKVVGSFEDFSKLLDEFCSNLLKIK